MLIAKYITQSIQIVFGINEMTQLLVMSSMDWTDTKRVQHFVLSISTSQENLIHLLARIHYSMKIALKLMNRYRFSERKSHYITFLRFLKANMSEKSITYKVA